MNGAKLDFVPPRTLRHHHLQSIYPSLPLRRAGRGTARGAFAAPRRRRAGRLRGRRAPARARDHAGEPRPAAVQPGSPCCCTAGKAARTRSTCCRSGSSCSMRGYDVVRLNLRDHGDSHHLNPEIFHSCRIAEVVGAVHEPAADDIRASGWCSPASRWAATSACAWVPGPRRQASTCRASWPCARCSTPNTRWCGSSRAGRCTASISSGSGGARCAGSSEAWPRGLPVARRHPASSAT